MGRIRTAYIMIASMLIAQCAQALPVVPGAFGFGMDTRAAYACGMDPTIYRVTNLNDTGSGSFRAAAEASDPRVVIFETSGTIVLQSDISIIQPCITIAGQTAPSPGITIRGAAAASVSAGGIVIYTHDVLIQHIRIRTGDGGPTLPQTAAHDALLLYNILADVYNVVIDHLSISWAGGKNTNLVAGSLMTTTVWRSIISEALYYASNVTVSSGQPASLGTLVGGTGGGGSASIIGTLYAHNSDRNPEVHESVNLHFVNNVVYDWGKDTTAYPWGSFFYAPGSGAWLADIVGNQYVAGCGTHPFTPLYAVGTWSGDTGSHVYINDNAIDQTCTAVTDYFNNMGSDPRVGSPAVSLSGFTVTSSTGTETFVLANAGARPVDRDTVDTRIVNEVRTRTGTVIAGQGAVGGWPTLTVNSRALTTPASPHTATASGYTNLEVWLHGYASGVEVNGSAPAPVTGIRIAPR